MRLDIQGLDEWVRDFGQALKIADQGMAIAEKVAVDWRRETQLRAPVDTGNMRASVVTEAHLRGSVIEVTNTVPTNYAWFVEHGTSRTGPQPFQGPATDVVAPRFEAALCQAMERITGNPVRATGGREGPLGR